jgi:hypothetical protein
MTQEDAMNHPDTECPACQHLGGIPRTDGPPLCLTCDPELDRKASILWRKENPDESVFNATWDIKLKYALRILNGETP